MIFWGIYEVTKTYPTDERFCLISDMRRAANSITHNIAEGFGRVESRDQTRFYKISRGSTFELISQVIVSSKLGYISEKEQRFYTTQCKEIIKNINFLMKSIESPSNPQPNLNL